MRHVATTKLIKGRGNQRGFTEARAVCSCGWKSPNAYLRLHAMADGEARDHETRFNAAPSGKDPR